MRVFDRITPQKAESKDGVAVILKGRYRIRYQRPEKFCDLSCVPFVGDTSLGSTIPLTPGSRFGIEVLWHLPDGTTLSATDSEINEMKQDLKAAFAALGSAVAFD